MAADPPPLLTRGRCPIVQLGSSFKTNQFAGKWFKIGGLHNPREKAVQCTLYDYQKNAAGFQVSSSGLTSDNSPITEGNTLRQNEQNVGSFLATFHDLEANMTVLTTDYTSYACVYTCYNFESSHKTQFAWILSRESTLPRQKIADCQVELRRVGVPLKDLSATKQDGCTYT
ncbi:unnamed protein product [Meganyctiphanes norvegica]|uniref:Lipocalin/cytosolic fatty-acid binding domain-containing protein n=1 Tax=Meganyctiphanes norvegica TaxID=48144 RepID=A0AAV2PJB6_MEGNR